MFLDFITYLLGKITFFTGSVIASETFPKPLSKEEESDCLRRAKQGDKQAKEKLITHNMRLVAHIAKKYSGFFEQDDLLSVGSIGLIKAINTYEESKGTQLATYTARCIENEILMLLRSNKKHCNDVYLSDSIGSDKDGNELTLLDLLYEHEDCVYGAVETDIDSQKLLSKMKELLTEREFTVLCLRYGLKGGRSYPQREVAKFLKISRSYISRIETKALEKLKENMKKRDFYC